MIIDSQGRRFKKLRISLTDTCNLACQYCVPAGEDDSQNIIKTIKDKSLISRTLASVTDILEINPVESIQITGGEPLLVSGVEELIVQLKKLGVPKVKLTTNAVFLGKRAEALKKAGLDGINVSLDAIDEELFFQMTRRRNLKKVINGIEEAIYFGHNIKLNAVMLKGINESQIIPLYNFAKERKLTLRFLELMKMGHLQYDFEKYFVSQEEILNTLETHVAFYPLERRTSATANYWLTDDLIKVGVIANESTPFCSDCDRLRLDSKGLVYGCISSNKGFKLSDKSIEAKKIALLEALLTKQNQFQGSSTSMKSIGG